MNAQILAAIDATCDDAQARPEKVAYRRVNLPRGVQVWEVKVFADLTDFPQAMVIKLEAKRRIS